MKLWIINNWFKLLLSLFALIALAAVVFGLVILPLIKEQNRQHKEELDRDQAHQRELQSQIVQQDKKNNLDACINESQLKYNNNWANSCETNQKRIQDGYENCISTSLGASYCKTIWKTDNTGPDCSLPTSAAERWDESLKADKEECFKKYPQ